MVKVSFLSWVLKKLKFLKYKDREPTDIDIIVISLGTSLIVIIVQNLGLHSKIGRSIVTNDC